MGDSLPSESPRFCLQAPDRILWAVGKGKTEWGVNYLVVRNVAYNLDELSSFDRAIGSNVVGVTVHPAVSRKLKSYTIIKLPLKFSIA